MRRNLKRGSAYTYFFQVVSTCKSG